MEFTNTFQVAAPVERVWKTLTDVERVASCLPGAQLTSMEGDRYEGTVKVKVGPIRAQYRGRAHFREIDEAARRIALSAEGREARGQGTAAATVTSALSSDGDGGTSVAVHTELHLTGKVAQFGGDALSEVTGRLLTQFANNLENRILTPADTAMPEPEAAPPQSETSARPPTGTPSLPRTPVHRDKDAELDLLQSAGGVMARRAAPYVAVSVLLLLIGWTLGRASR